MYYYCIYRRFGILELLDRCIIYAVLKHSGQLDKAGLPYIYHPLRVMLSDLLVTEEQKCIAILHDTLEDTSATIVDLVTLGLPHRVVSAVVALTHIRNEPNIQYWQRVLDEPTGDARLVKLADIHDNTSETRLGCLTKEDQVRLQEKYKQAKEYLS